MICPSCKSDKTAVIDSRDVDLKAIRRRRECDDCKYRFTTYERVEPVKLNVAKRDGKVEQFDREKIIRGIKIAANDRISDPMVSDVADEIEQKLLELGEPAITSKKIGNLVISKLKKIDEIAYIRFASVYKNFQDIDSFEQELVKLKK
ncbi:MAG: transcriptional regulator NrdR [Candidatus Berkelbacteria bacterium]|nr:transcriptional regulator NrdR [Candidatus Berkelbacteria bacterium]